MRCAIPRAVDHGPFHTSSCSGCTCGCGAEIGTGCAMRLLPPPVLVGVARVGFGSSLAGRHRAISPRMGEPRVSSASRLAAHERKVPASVSTSVVAFGHTCVGQRFCSWLDVIFERLEVVFDGDE